jgi:hypothetical protein
MDAPPKPSGPRRRGPARPTPTVAPARLTRLVVLLLLVPLVGVLAGACAPSNPSTSSTARPRTSAHLQIDSPTPNQVVTGTSTDLKLSLRGATVVSPSQVTGIDPTEGHIHVSLDGKLVSMTYGLSQPLTGLTPGTHTVQAEFVASDHRAFANRVVAAVVFQVQ